MNRKEMSLIDMQRLRNGEEIECPECKDGKLIARGNPETAEYYYCNNVACGLTVMHDGEIQE